jgi:transposase
MLSSMVRKPLRLHVDTIVRKHRGKTYVSHLLRHSYRDGTQVRHRTLANLSHLPTTTIDLIRRSLKGETFITPQQTFRITQAKAHGHVHAVLGTLRKLGLDILLAARPSRRRNLAVALIVARLLFPCSKLATPRHWQTTTLAEELGVQDATMAEIYQTLDWLGHRQAAVERQLARRHLRQGGLVLYDVSSSFYYGRTCPLARHGHNRDGKKGLPIIVYGLLADAVGRPLAIQVFPGNTGDPATVPSQVDTLRQRFGCDRIVLVGDRGMLTQTQIDHLRQFPGLGWISALRSAAIRRLLDDGHVQRSSLEAVHLAEIDSPDFPDERLVVCFNPRLAQERRRKRQVLLEQTEVRLQRLVQQVARRTRRPLGQADIGIKAGRILQRSKVAKHYQLDIADGHFAWCRREEAIGREEELDGLYVIRTSEPKQRLSAAEAVRSYKRLGLVEQAFRSLKGVDLLVRPIHHRVPPRVRAHLFLCMLAYYVEWELRRCWAPLLFAEEDLEGARQARDPVLPAEATEETKAKKRTKQTAQGLEVQSFRSLLAQLASQTKNTCEVVGDDSGSRFEQVSEATALQAEALRLLQL